MNEIKYNAIHESILKDIVDVISDVKDIAKNKNFQILKSGEKKSMKSISSATKDLILSFPVLCTADISMEAAQMIVKAQERKCATMIQLLIATLNFSIVKQVKDGIVTQVRDVQDYIDDIHSNMTDDIFGGLSDDLIDFARNKGIISAASEAAEDYLNDSNVKAEMREYLIEALNSPILQDDINRQSLGRFIVENTIVGRVITEADDDDDDDEETTNTFNIAKDDYRNNGDRFVKFAGSQMLQSKEIKKANELQPTMMAVNFNQVDANGQYVGSRAAIIGIKCKLYPIDYTDAANHITAKTKEKNKIFNLIRATTSEISFMKDFTLAINKAKIDAKSFSKAASASNKMWKVLERRSVKSSHNRLMNNSNDCSAITTLVVSKNLAEYVKKSDNIDIMKANTARLLMESYNLMSLVVVDESMEVAYFLYDTGEDNFEAITFSGLEKEGNDGAYRKVVNLLSKKM